METKNIGMVAAEGFKQLEEVMVYSGHALLPHLKILQQHFLEPLTDNNERFRSAYFDLELLPYAMGAAWYALSEFARLQREMIAEFPAERLEGLAFFGLSTDERDLLSYMLDNFLDNARRAQDAVIHYLSRGLKVSHQPACMTWLTNYERAAKYFLNASNRKP